MKHDGVTLRGTQTRSPGRLQRGGGLNMILFLMFLAVALGLLVGLGARTWTRAAIDRGAARLSSEAADLGYKAERDFLVDRGRAEVALGEVLASPAGAQRIWENAETGNRGLLWASEETTRRDGTSCRNVERRTLINGAYRNGASVACRTRQGNWDSAVRWHAE